MKRKSRRGSSHLHQREATVRAAGATPHSSGASGRLSFGVNELLLLDACFCMYMQMIRCIYADDVIVYCG